MRGGSGSAGYVIEVEKDMALTAWSMRMTATYDGIRCMKKPLRDGVSQAGRSQSTVSDVLPA